jgi:transcriptional regulator with XRE-family HTH domain
MQTANIITAELSRRNITQAELAEHIGVHYSTVSKILNGKRNPSIKNAEAISNFFGCRLQDAFPDAYEKKMKREAIAEKKSSRLVAPQALKILRKEVKKLMVDLDRDHRGSLPGLSAQISGRLRRRINRNSLSMALTGYRLTASSRDILETARDILSSEIEILNEGN